MQDPQPFAFRTNAFETYDVEALADAQPERRRRYTQLSHREQLGTTPVRYLKLRRLNRIRRDLRASAPGATVTDVALRAGIWDLGRLAGEYRALFGALPSETLRSGSGEETRPEPFAQRHGGLGRAVPPLSQAPRRSEHR